MKNRMSMVGPPDLAKMKRQFQISFLKAQGLKPDHKLLDFGCGVLRGGIPLIRYLDVGNYTGVDVRGNVLQEAQKELSEHRLQHKHPNIIRFYPDLELKEFDYIWCFSVFFHMGNKELEEFFSFAKKHLSGRIYANVNLGDDKQISNWQDFPVWEHSLEYYQLFANRYGMDCGIVGRLSDLGHNSGNEKGDGQYMLYFSKQSV